MTKASDGGAHGSAVRALADIVADYMEHEGLTLQAMADRTGLSIASIAALRTGTRGKRPQPHTLAKLAAVMGHDPADLEMVIEATADDRRREQLLVRHFRSLDDDAKAQVERLVSRLRPASSSDRAG